MQAEPRKIFAACARLEAKTGLRRIFARLARAVGLQTRTDASPKLLFAHPVERLTFQNHLIYELHRGQPGREYLPLAGVEILRKLSWRERSDDSCEYRFELNAAPDNFWQSLFQRFFPGLQARFDSRTLIVVCAAAELEATFQSVKQAMLLANAWYAEEREMLIAQIIPLDAQRRAAVELEENRRRGLQMQFESLEL